MSDQPAIRGVIYDDQYGHVCTCTQKDEGEFYSYKPTVKVARDVEPTETGSWYYVCSRCGAGAWSGL